MITNPIISVKNLVKSYDSVEGSHTIINDLSLNIYPKDKLGIIGTNGSGKSTLLKILIGEINYNSGAVMNTFKGFENVSYLPQDYRNALAPWLNIKSNLSLLFERNNSLFGLGISSELKLRFLELCDILKVKIPLDRFPYQLSGGEKQTLLLINAILSKPKIIFADEPFSAIDFNKKELILNYYNDWISKNNITSIVISHDIRQIIALSNRIIILNKKNNQIKNQILLDSLKHKGEITENSKEFQNLIDKIKRDFT